VCHGRRPEDSPFPWPFAWGRGGSKSDGASSAPCGCALETYVDICLGERQDALAAQVAREAIALEPFRESSHQRLMRCEAALGNRAEAVRVYHRCREMLRDELGVEPSPETRAQFLKLLRESGDPEAPLRP
jgi:hypothetical protein